MDMVANVKTMPYTGSVYVNGEPRRDSSGEVHGMVDAFQGAMGYVSPPVTVACRYTSEIPFA